MSKPLLEVTKLEKRYPVRSGLFRYQDLVAADDISLTLRAGETLALVGESGSGKSTVGRCVLRLDSPSGGRVLLGEQVITDLRTPRCAGCGRICKWSTRSRWIRSSPASRGEAGRRTPAAARNCTQEPGP